MAGFANVTTEPFPVVVVGMWKGCPVTRPARTDATFVVSGETVELQLRDRITFHRADGGPDVTIDAVEIRQTDGTLLWSSPITAEMGDTYGS